jgi:hypothetical protein
MVSSVREDSTCYVLTVRHRQDSDPRSPQRTHTIYCDWFAEAVQYLAATYHAFSVIDEVSIAVAVDVPRETSEKSGDLSEARPTSQKS